MSRGFVPEARIAGRKRRKKERRSIKSIKVDLFAKSPGQEGSQPGRQQASSYMARREKERDREIRKSLEFSRASFVYLPA